MIINAKTLFSASNSLNTYWYALIVETSLLLHKYGFERPYFPCHTGDHDGDSIIDLLSRSGTYISLDLKLVVPVTDIYEIV